MDFYEYNRESFDQKKLGEQDGLDRVVEKLTEMSKEGWEFVTFVHLDGSDLLELLVRRLVRQE